MKKIVIVGAGYAGVHAAKVLLKKLEKNKDIELVLIDKNPFHTLMTELHEVAGGRAEEDSVRIPLSLIFGGRKIRIITDRVQGIDFENKNVTLSTGQESFDYLILGVGAEPEFFGIPGIQENSFTLWSYDDALRIREHVKNQFLRASREADPEKRKVILTFSVAGAGFTGIEMLGELLEWRPILCREYGIIEEEVTILLVEAMTEILPMLPKKLRVKSMAFIEKKKGKIMLNTPITKASPGAFQIKTGAEIKTETLIWTCGVKGNDFIRALDLEKAATSNEEMSEDDRNLRYNIKKKCRLETNDRMQSLKYSYVYSVGDITWFSEKNRTLPQIVETALQTGSTAAHNIINDIQGKVSVPHKSNYHGFMVSIGSKFAVANVIGLVLTGFMAMAMKHMVNLHYLWEVAGVQSCWQYLVHHFFNAPHGRSQLGSELSAKIPAYWALPLRVYLGFLWAIQGVDKILKGWLSMDGKSQTGWMFTPGVSQAGLPVDAISAASDAWEEGGTVVETAVTTVVVDATAAATDAWDAGTEAITSTATQAVISLEKWLASPIFYNPVIQGPTVPPQEPWFFVQWNQWFMDNVISQVPYWLLQWGVALGELGIGLALMAGLFTFPTAVASIVLSLVFTISGVFTWTQLFYIFGAAVLMGGAGRVAGLDYWVLPWLEKGWKKTKMAKRNYWFTGKP